MPQKIKNFGVRIGEENGKLGKFGKIGIFLGKKSVGNTKNLGKFPKN